jgi:hypothetical protein
MTAAFAAASMLPADQMPRPGSHCQLEEDYHECRLCCADQALHECEAWDWECIFDETMACEFLYCRDQVVEDWSAQLSYVVPGPPVVTCPAVKYKTLIERN